MAEAKQPDLEDTRPAEKAGGFTALWELISHAGLAETAIRLGTHTLSLALILLIAWGLREFYLGIPEDKATRQIVFAVEEPTPTPVVRAPDLPAFRLQGADGSGVSRQARLHTDIPSRARPEVLVYTVKPGDTLFGIADKFGLNPETILWANQFVLGDNPHSLRPGQTLNILPVDGTYHRWSTGDSLIGVAKFFNVTAEDIIDFPGNNLSTESVDNLTSPDIPPGEWLVIPGGQREFVSWSAPEIPRDNPSVARVLGPGVCETVVEGNNGGGVFVWPSDHQYLSGFDFVPEANHPGIDIDGDEGAPVYAADSGVAVYAGWNNWGYGYVVVLNHGNGWQTLYAHLDEYYVGCGQSVWQGDVIGTVGSSGNSTGPHLHFEMMFEGVRVNPHDYLP